MSFFAGMDRLRLQAEKEKRKQEEPMLQRFQRYVEESHRDGVMGEYRYSQMLGKVRKLRRFLIIKGKPAIGPSEFDVGLLLEYRQFIYDEYLFVPRFPELYPRGGGRRAPKKRCRDNSVVHEMKALRAFFGELENSGEIPHSPFKKLSGEKRRRLMHVMYDEPFFLRAAELRRLMDTPVPEDLQSTKDLFVLNCAIGCRIGDLKSLTMDKLSLSADGIPYIHYLPSKTLGTQLTHREVKTPLIRPALEIVQRTGLRFGTGHSVHYERQVYNAKLRRLLRLCGITRRVSVFDPALGDNVYKPLCEVASSKLARKTHVDMLSKVQINFYAAGLHSPGSQAVFRYTSLELSDHFALLNAAFGEKPYRLRQL